MLFGLPHHLTIWSKVRCIAITGLTNPKGQAIHGNADALLPTCSFGHPSARLSRITDGRIIFSKSFLQKLVLHTELRKYLLQTPSFVGRKIDTPNRFLICLIPKTSFAKSSTHPCRHIWSAIYKMTPISYPVPGKAPQKEPRHRTASIFQ